MTEKRYFDAPLTLDFEAQVLQSTAQNDGTFYTILDLTYFYPTGGGQSHDTGTIGAAAVLDVLNDGDDVIHVTSAAVDEGIVSAHVAKDARWRNMQAHTGQHLLSAAFVHELDADTVSVKMATDGASTVDITLGNLTSEQITQVEQAANRVILENRDVKSYFVTPENVPQEKMRRPLPIDKITGDVRIVEIVDWDTSACAGTHLPNTGMIGLLKILKVENYKGGSRVYFVVGYNALDAFRQYQTVIDSLSNTMSTGLDTLLENVEKVLVERADMSKTVVTQRHALMQYEAQDLLKTAKLIGTIALIIAQVENRDATDLKILVNAITEQTNTVAVFVNQQGADMALVFAASQDSGVHAGNIAKAIFSEFNGRGGGSQTYAQGILSSDNNLDALITAIEHYIVA